MTCAHRDMSS